MPITLALPLRRIVKKALSRSVKVSYPRWIASFDTLSASDRAAVRSHIGAFAARPEITVLISSSGGASEALLSRSLRSLQRQLYPHWTSCVADGWRDRNKVLEVSGSAYTALLEAGDELSEHALYFAALEFQRHPGARLLFSDEDRIDGRGRRHDPCFKPDFSPDLFLSQGRALRLAVYEPRLLREVGGFRPDFGGSRDLDLALRCTERLSPAEIRHIPRVLYHVGDGKPAVLAPGDAGGAIQAHLDRVSPGARVVAASRAPGCHRVIYPAADTLVSIVIPTRDHRVLLSRCVESIRRRTDYPRYEILIVDNGSSDPETLAYLEALSRHGEARLLRDARPFNYSALNNRAAQEARGEILVLLNDDTEVIGRDWLREMASQAWRREVGLVGAKLYYPDGAIHHAGIVLGLAEVAGHHHDGFPRNAGGYFGNLLLAGNPSAVTAACCAVRKELYLAAGGLDEDLPRDFNDIDFCLRLRERGLRVLWTPYAELIHHVSASRGSLNVPANLEAFGEAARWMRRRWGDERITNDSAYNPNLSLEEPDFRLASRPRLDMRPYLRESRTPA
ncbi:MAG: glycosyltransferase family 2 protein [Elusimicrobia bacterium]|nr:glycosyltransferase family 2 protein [Elusimicrobiota bacterium]